MLWLYLALTAYFINACVFIIDKYLLANTIPKYYAYAFGVSILSLSSFILIPFGVSWHGSIYFLITIASGISFFVGLLFFYRSIKESDISIAATQVGTMSAVFTYILSILILRDTFHTLNFFAFLFLIAGIFMLGRIKKTFFLSAFFAGLLFGFYYVLLKLSFNLSDFVNGLFWTRIGFVGSAFASLFFSGAREEIKSAYKNAPNRSKSIFVINKFLAGVGFIILYFAIQLGNVSLVNALLGIQFVFTFILALILGRKFSSIKESLNMQILRSKLVGLLSIVVGLLILFSQ